MHIIKARGKKKAFNIQVLLQVISSQQSIQYTSSQQTYKRNTEI